MYTIKNESDLSSLLSFLQDLNNKTSVQIDTKGVWTSLTSAIDDSSITSSMLKASMTCLCQLIIASEDAFKPYASATLYKALDCLTEREDDDELRVISLNCIYALTRYCDEQILPLKNNIVDYMNLLKNGKNEKIDMLCAQILAHYEMNSSTADISMLLHRKTLSIQLLSDDSGDFVNFKMNNNTNEEKELTFKKEEVKPPIESKEEKQIKTKIDFDKQSEEDINIELLQKRIKELSDHQLFLLDTIENYKTTTHKIISEKKNKISELERKIAKLSEEIQKEIYKNSNISYNSNKNPNGNMTTSDIIVNHIQSQNDSALIKLFNSLSLSQLKQIKGSIFEKSIEFLIYKCRNRKNTTKSIIKTIKTVLLGIKVHISDSTKEIISSYLMEISNRRKDYTNYLTENDFIDINLLLSHLSSMY